jgi:lipoprotein-releasing system ATP-binding protein
MLAELQNVSKSYQQQGIGNQNLVLDQISLSIRENETIAILGPSGSGKSTLLNILGTLDRPTSGKVVLNGEDVSRKDNDFLAGYRSRFIGHVFQQHYLLPQLTLLENVLLPILTLDEYPDSETYRKRALELIDRVGLSDHLNHFPFTLSVGECQRAAVVRALINRPKLLLADEPTGSLDAENAVLLGNLLVELHKEENIALCVVTHSADLAKRMQQKYSLISGRLQRMENP